MINHAHTQTGLAITLGFGTESSFAKETTPQFCVPFEPCTLFIHLLGIFTSYQHVQQKYWYFVYLYPR